jgi:ubiquinone/menaquinone biosynthesis C-methylase UbiE
MPTLDHRFGGSISEIYERSLVPLIFAPYAADMAARAAMGAPRDLLETAAGTGVLTRALARRLGPAARITATDLNSAMLDEAIRRQPAGPAIEWRQADALALPFAEASFDLVACQFGVMFFPDKRRGYAEALRVLRPAGRFLFSVWDEIGRNDFAAVVTEALAEIFPSDPPRFMARTPHGYHDVETIRRELGGAGFGEIAVEAIDHVSRAASAQEAAIAYCQGTPLRNEIEARDASLLDRATTHAAEALARRLGSGAVAGRIRAYVVTARR